MAGSNRRGRESRERILEVAVKMFQADPGVPLSVRSVAAAAGLSAGSLRYAFPTQRELQDAVLARIAEVAFPPDAIADSSTPARERLLRCLQHILATVGLGDEARAAWSSLFHAFIEPEPSAELRAAQRAADSATRVRIGRWLTVLHSEGVLVSEDIARHTQFLCSVLNGLAFERALPNAQSTLRSETQVLETAVAAVVHDQKPDE